MIFNNYAFQSVSDKVSEEIPTGFPAEFNSTEVKKNGKQNNKKTI